MANAFRNHQAHDYAERQLIVWTKKSVTALNPKTGGERWRERVLTGSDYAVSTPVYRDERLLLGGLMLKLDAPDQPPTTLWPDTRATSHRVLSNTSTPLFEGDHVYSARSKGQPSPPFLAPMKSKFILLTALLLSSFVIQHSSFSAEGAKPNVLILLADDLGVPVTIESVIANARKGR